MSKATPAHLCLLLVPVFSCNTSPSTLSDSDAGPVCCSSTTCTPLAAEHCFGGICTRLASGQASPQNVAAGPTGVYWNNGGDGTLMTLAPGATAPRTLAQRPSAASALALGNTNVYWTETNAGNVLALPLAGGTAITVSAYPPLVYAPAAIASSAGRIYWTNASAAVLSEPAAGGAVDVVALGQANPQGVAVDADAVYWVNAGTGAADGSVVKAPLAGGLTVTLASLQPRPHAITLDTANVYWTNSGAVCEVPKSGGKVTTLSAVSTPSGIAVADSVLYYTGYDGTDSEGAVWSMPIGGTASEIAVHQKNPSSLAIDETNIYWTDDDPIDGSVLEMERSGSIVDAPAVLATGRSHPRGLAVDGTNVYWVDAAETEGPGAVLRTSIAEGGVVATVAANQAQPNVITVDAGRLYWGNWGTLRNGLADSTVASVDSAGGPIQTLAGNPNLIANAAPIGIAADDSGLYWTNAGALTVNNGSVVHLAAGAASPTVLAVGVSPFSVVVDGTHSFYADINGAIVGVSNAGGTPTTLASGQAGTLLLASSPTDLYWMTVGVDWATGANYLSTGTLWAVSKEGGAPVAVESSIPAPAGLAADATGVYWTSQGGYSDCFADGKVFRLAPDAGAPTVIASGQLQPLGITVQNGTVYWVNDGLPPDPTGADAGPDGLPADLVKGSVMTWHPGTP
jgi:hypothetical protein